MVKICYIDLWSDLINSPLTLEAIHDLKLWSKCFLSRAWNTPVSQGVGLLHFNELNKYLNVELVSNPADANVLICSCFGQIKQKFPEKKKIFLGFESQCNETTYTQLPNCLFISNYASIINNINSIYMNLYCLYHGFDIYQQLTVPRQLSQPKKGFCLSIISNTEQSIRMQFILKLSQYKKVDNYGRLLKNRRDALIEHTTWYDPRLIERIKNYKFMICFENKTIPGYHTEKIVMGLLGETIPIYWGDPNINTYFNKDAIVNVNHLGFDSAIHRIIELDQDEAKYLSTLREKPIIEHLEEYDENRFRQRIKDFIGGDMLPID